MLDDTEDDLRLSADLFCLYFSDTVHSVLAIPVNRPGKGVWYFHMGERVPPGGGGVKRSTLFGAELQP